MSARRQGFVDELEKLSTIGQRVTQGLGNLVTRQIHGLTGRGIRDAAHAAQVGLDPQAFQAGMSSIPGIVRSLGNASTREAAARYAGHTLVGGGTLPGKIMAGAPVAFAVPSLIKGDESARGGQSMRQKLVGLGTNMAVGAATGGLPILTGMGVQLATDAGTKALVNRL